MCGSNDFIKKKRSIDRAILIKTHKQVYRDVAHVANHYNRMYLKANRCNVLIKKINVSLCIALSGCGLD